ncbi:DUF2510 domain-containing protein [Microbacterium sp. KSW2-29]|uniref:DUF2510 domain-containing protein n=1 Tax=Microbacterium phycohabitans TaxID=3075993 RepID=A0ABU3SHG7_9MICO|nr:DUF2510 domain-containing protein [Microbacterium sp. KSW2-29]MDU0344096.1 DUF2510 domain-containing protein [Microbacterium sp. KSW2-29]
MEGSTMSTPPGWYPEASSPTGQRYWDGATWTTHTTPAAPVTAPPPLPVTVSPSYDSVPLLEAPDGYTALTPNERKALPRNPLATTGMWLAIASGVISVTLLLQLGALVLSIIGLIRSRRIREVTGVAVGRTKAILGICISALATLWFFVVVVPAIATWFAPAPFDEAGTEQAILTWSNQQGLAFVNIDCPAAPSMNEGNTFTCVGGLEDGVQYAIEVNVKEAGYLTWQLARG